MFIDQRRVNGDLINNDFLKTFFSIAQMIP